MPTSTPLIDYGKLIPVEVYYDDLDAMGILHHVRYGMLLDRAITAYYADRGYAFGADNPDTFTAIRQLSIEYLAPVAGTGRLLIHLWINRVGRTSVEYGFHLLSADSATVHAEGRRVGIKLDPATLRPTPWSDEIRAIAAGLQRPTEQMRS